MPRPYGLVSDRGEGMYKGVGSVDLSQLYNPFDIVSIDPYVDPSHGYKQYYDAVRDFQASNTSPLGTNNIPLTPRTLGEWVQKNQAMLVVGAIVGLLMFKR